MPGNESRAKIRSWPPPDWSGTENRFFPSRGRCLWLHRAAGDAGTREHWQARSIPSSHPPRRTTLCH